MFLDSLVPWYDGRFQFVGNVYLGNIVNFTDSIPSTSFIILQKLFHDKIVFQCLWENVFNVESLWMVHCWVLVVSRLFIFVVLQETFVRDTDLQMCWCDVTRYIVESVTIHVRTSCLPSTFISTHSNHQNIHNHLSSKGEPKITKLSPLSKLLWRVKT